MSGDITPTFILWYFLTISTFGLKKLNNKIWISQRLKELTHLNVCTEFASESKSSFKLIYFFRKNGYFNYYR